MERSVRLESKPHGPVNAMNKTERPYDAVIVGARCAGAATAMMLAHGGARVLALERSRHGSDTLSTHALMRGGVSQLHRWGLLDRVKASGMTPVAATTFYYGEESVEVEIKPKGRIDALYAPRRDVLDKILVDAAVEAGAEVRHGVEVTDLNRDEHGRLVGSINHL